MKIVMLGIRGVPARYGGLETCGEEVGARLVERGHEVICYCRRGSPDDGTPECRGIRRIELPRIKTKATDTYSHSFLAFWHALIKEKPDVILAFNPGIGTLCAIPKLFGCPVALNPDGFDWKRKKWGGFAKWFIHFNARVASRLADQMIIDAVSVRDYYASHFRYRREPLYIPNGAPVETSENPDIIKQYGLEKDGYFLFLSRFVPENSCEVIIKAFEGLKTDKKLFMGGGSEQDGAYAASVIHSTKDPRIVFPGGIYDPAHVKELHCGCYALLHGNQPGGTSLGLLKAMGYGTCCVTLNTPDNAYAVKNGSGVVYDLTPESLRARLQELLDHPEAVAEYRRKAVERIKEEYLWEVVTDKYEKALKAIARSR
ncbi:MAG TPA: glycosyltransferase [Candidatus Hydrogenedentes bacterium]|nr:glycosyltransferase [Candidatus Hydrogenedentota bacterium]HRT20758.1 glycosyltransferase [Candidatus Hydrogenedentota bacterium]HRT66760.1 glycosyltransferase [Candidatus Hydrogenedentota bacterium]